MRSKHHIFTLTFCLFVLSTASHADSILGRTATDSGPGSANQPRIVEVLVNSQDETITIVLEDSGPGLIQVELGGASSPFGNVTAACTEDLESTPQSIVCDFSDSGLATGLPPAGDYLLTVASEDDPAQTDDYDLTIGNQALAGKTCPSGTYVTGFDANGDVLCSGADGSSGSGAAGAGTDGGDGTSAGSDSPAACGNGILDTVGEQCDDGNTVSGDGCSATCQVEAPCGDGTWSCVFDHSEW